MPAFACHKCTHTALHRTLPQLLLQHSSLAIALRFIHFLNHLHMSSKSNRLIVLHDSKRSVGKVFAILQLSFADVATCAVRYIPGQRQKLIISHALHHDGCEAFRSKFPHNRAARGDGNMQLVGAC